ncbi:conserved hypothetical protein [Magnetospirillum sp. LM-5]|uniref:hypothetical protein n=1 Tax=Magnetospirillum sp. LM-5 TaxID=2681466 RepID=UPI00137D56CF|nr:hypothetical protein [Magnetospirillum sp. LM-5]CAA7621334.1 conserved hypothetical protein [Magnetospirillum sp. LM-5]
MTALPAFLDLVHNAAAAHASEVNLRIEDGRTQVVAMVRGDAILMAETGAEQAQTFLADAFSRCDGADSFTLGSARMMRMTGERAPLPDGISTALVQFLPLREGGRALVVRLSYEGDVCCGTCGG